MKRISMIFALSILVMFELTFGNGLDTLYSIEEIYKNQLIERDSLNILFQITFPSDSDTFSIDKVRYGAWTVDTASVVHVDGVEQKVYSSGAFPGMFNLEPGWNNYSFLIESEDYKIDTTFHLYRIPPVETLPVTPTRIIDKRMFPANDIYYYSPDKIVVRFIGSPEGEAHFKIPWLTGGMLPMVELPANRVNGLNGVYEGVYLIKDTDKCNNKPVVFELRGKDNSRVRKKSKARINIVQSGQLKLLETVDSISLVRYAPWGEIFMELPAGIIVQGIAKYGGWWKVKVSKNREAYISSRTVEELPDGQDFIHASLYSVFAEVDTMDSNWININFNLSDRVPFRVVQEISPQMISLYFYSTHFQNEWTVYPYPDSFIDHINWVMEDDDILRWDVYLNTKQQWGFRGKYNEDMFVLSIRKPPCIKKENPFENLIIALDAGHGGEHLGAVGATGVTEKDINIVYTYYLAQMLNERGAEVVITRTTDSTMFLGERVEIARKANAQLFLWLHNNSTGWTRHPLEVSGTSTYYTHLQGLPFARSVYPYLLNLGLEPFGEVHRTYYVTRQRDIVIFLVEGAFLSNPIDEMFLMKDENLKKLAKAVYDGLEDYLLKIAE